MSREEIIALLGDDWTAFQRLLRESLHSGIDIIDSFNEYVLSRSGKQLRPMLTLLVAGALGGINGDSVRFAALAEILHNATLLHDDVADDGTVRRGEPTIYATSGAQSSVLLGDYWLASVVDLVVDAGSADAIKSCSATLADLARGEMLQMQKAALADTTEEDYLDIIFCKTASLFQTSCRMGAISAGASPQMCEAAAKFGSSLGTAFQIKDDIFDYGDSSAIGKPVGSDLMERKITLPLIGALRGSPEEARIRSVVAAIPEHPEGCAEVRDFVLNGGGIEYAEARLQDFLDEALEALSAFPPSSYRDALESLTHYVSQRSV